MRKRLTSVLLSFSLILCLLFGITDILPASAAVSTFSLDCDTTDGWRTDATTDNTNFALGDFSNFGTVDTAVKTQGTGSLSMASTANPGALLASKVLFDWSGTAVNTGLTEENAVLIVDIYLTGDPWGLQNSSIQIGSASADVDAYKFIVGNGNYDTCLVKNNGWTTLVLPIKDASQKVGAPNLSAVSFFRFDSIFMPTNCVVKIDNIRLIDSTVFSLDCDSASGWKTDATTDNTNFVLGDFSNFGTVDTAVKTQGAGSLSMASTANPGAFLASKVLFDWSGLAYKTNLSEADAVLVIDIYLEGDPWGLQNSSIQIGSASADVDAYKFIIGNGNYDTCLVKDNGWTTLKLPLADADEKIGAPNLNSVSFFRLDSIIMPTNCVVKIDNIRLVNKSVLTDDTPSTPDNNTPSTTETTEPSTPGTGSSAVKSKFFLNCDSSADWSTDISADGKNLVIGDFLKYGQVDSKTFTEGSGSLSMNSSANPNAILPAKVLFEWNGQSKINSGLTESEAVLMLDVWVDNEYAFNFASSIQIGSASAENDAYKFVLGTNGDLSTCPVRKTGWTTLALPLKDAQKLGSPNLKAITFFRLESIIMPPNATVKIDNIRLVSTSDSDAIDAASKKEPFLLDCDDMSGWQTDVSVDGKEFLLGDFSKYGKVDTRIKKQGSGSLSMNSSANPNAILPAKVLFDWKGDAVHTGLDEDTAVLLIDVWVDNAYAFNFASSVQIGSASAEVDAYKFTIDTANGDLRKCAINKTGWTTLVLPLKKATKLGNPDLNAISYFRIESIIMPPNTTVKIDNVRLIDGSTSPWTGDKDVTPIVTLIVLLALGFFAGHLLLVQKADN